VADVVPFERRGRAMGIVMSAFSVSTVAGVPWACGWPTTWAGRRRLLALPLLSGCWRWGPR
jgi:predicted MFS family arabinose efflux permease